MSFLDLIRSDLLNVNLDIKKRTSTLSEDVLSNIRWYILYYFNLRSSETLNLMRPLARLRASNFLPFLDFILERKPCLLFLFLRDG